jgi:hypothetical protein
LVQRMRFAVGLRQRWVLQLHELLRLRLTESGSVTAVAWGRELGSLPHCRHAARTPIGREAMKPYVLDLAGPLDHQPFGRALGQGHTDNAPRHPCAAPKTRRQRTGGSSLNAVRVFVRDSALVRHASTCAGSTCPHVPAEGGRPPARGGPTACGWAQRMGWPRPRPGCSCQSMLPGAREPPCFRPAAPAASLLLLSLPECRRFAIFH